MRLLVIEDDDRLRSMVEQRLRESGYAVDTASDGEEGLYMARGYPIDLAIIDLGLPRLSGLDVVRELRSEGSKLPILLLTARDQWQDKVSGLEAGADDYLTKPFHLPELLARIQALLRRSAGHASAEVKYGPLRIHLSRQEVSAENGTINLTSYEYKLLEYLVLHPGEVLSKQVLNEHLYDEDADPDSNVLEVLIGRLRKKIDPDGQWQPIETLRGRGYRLRSEPAA